MKKLFFAAIAAIVMVSVSNVFANNAMTVSNNSAVADSTVVDTTDTRSDRGAERLGSENGSGSCRHSTGNIL